MRGKVQNSMLFASSFIGRSDNCLKRKRRKEKKFMQRYFLRALLDIWKD